MNDHRGNIATQSAYGTILVMIKKLKKRQADKDLSPQARIALMAVLVTIGAIAIAIAVYSIVIVPLANPASRSGVGADGFQAFVERGGSLDIANVVSKKDVVDVLGKKAKSVSDADVSKVFNIDGTRGQTVTYDFVRDNGLKASLYIDLMWFKDSATFGAIDIKTGTGDAGKIDGYPAYYMHAQTLSSEREYRLMVVKGLKVYKFVISQPYRTISISEVSALAALKRLAEKAEL